MSEFTRDKLDFIFHPERQLENNLREKNENFCQKRPEKSLFVMEYCVNTPIPWDIEITFHGKGVKGRGHLEEVPKALASREQKLQKIICHMSYISYNINQCRSIGPSFLSAMPV